MKQSPLNSFLSPSLRASGMIHRGPRKEIGRFTLPWPIQRSSEEVTETFCPSYLPWWRSTSNTFKNRNAYCPVSRGFLP